MRKKTKMIIDPKYILIAISVICAILIVVSFKFQDKIEPVRSIVGGVVTPMQKGINTIGVKISDKLEYVNSVKKLTKENKKLKDKLAETNAENKLLQQDKYELENFRKLYSLDEQYAKYPKVAARVISGEPDNWYNEFIIDNGTDDGLAKNMNVMAGDGLVGRIVDANKSYSRVRSIVDDSSEVSGSFLKTSDKCIVSGNLSMMKEGKIQISGLDRDAKVKDGYEVVTSQISSVYLPGILIGYAKNIKKDSTNITQSGYLVPAADFSSLDMVLVITKVKNSKDLEEILGK